MKSTLLKKRSEMRREPLPECHGGIGALDFTMVLDGSESPGKHINFFHDDILPSGVSIGVHQHEDDEEYYYIVSGHGVMTLDGTEFDVGSGDIAAVFPGGYHGLRNDRDEDLRIIVVSVGSA